jgi:predicted CXXCH cytochrome family protein
VSRKAWLLVVAGIGLVGIAAMFFLGRGSPFALPPEQVKSDYVDSATCAGCHQAIAKSYHLTGMGRSLFRPRLETTVEDYKTHNSIYNRTSDRYYTMLERDGKWIQRRHQIGLGGQEINVEEKPVDYVMGSGNHVRSYLNRTTQGTLVELPVSWYAEKGGYWGMSPGYDRPNQEDFRRTIMGECMFCHNGYPAKEKGTNLDGSEPLFGDRIPEGIDCQRCHGPGRAHVEAAGSGHAAPDAIRRAIVNPAKLDRDRQTEVCLQCHLETSSRPLPNRIRRYNLEFTYRPGEPLGDSFVFFDHPSGTGHDDKFEIAHAAYRLRMSVCFRSTQMTCTTCHDPHNIPRGEEAVQHYTEVCRSCHPNAHSTNKVATGSNCIACHMPKRRTEDAVHVVMTDHYIQRIKPVRDLLAPLQESSFEAADNYRGEVIPYYPSQLPKTPEENLYLDVAQVHDSANLKLGIPRLQQDIEKYSPVQPEFYYELGEAYAKTGNQDAAIHWFEEALRRRADFRPALAELGRTLITAGQFGRATEVLEKAAALPSPDTVVLVDLGGAYLREGNLPRSEQALQRALNVNPEMPEAHNLLGLLLGQKEDWPGAEKHLREAISSQPDLAEAHYNLGNLLVRANRYNEAQFHFQKAIASNPVYLDAHYNYGLLLVLMRSYDKAIVELEETVRLDPNSAQAFTDLGDVLAAKGRLDIAAEKYQRAIQLNPESYPAHLSLGQILARKGSAAEARSHFEKAAQSSDPAVREAASRALH